MNHSSPSVHSLLSNFKSIVELVIKFPGDSLTSQYGAIERIRSAILSILSHGLKQNTGEAFEKLWQLIIRLNSNSEKYIRLLQDIYHKENLRFTVEQWIDQSLIMQCLSQQISYIEDDMGLLEQYYSSFAFMRKLPFYQAFVICIRTVESSDPSLLVTIDPKLSIIGDAQEPIAVPPIDETDRFYVSSVSALPNNQTNNAVVESKLSVDDSQYKVLPIANRRILHRRIHSDPVFHVRNNSNNYSRVTSSFLTHDISFDEHENSPDVSYSCEYGSTYDSRANSFLSIEQSYASDNRRQSISSKITLIDEDENQFYQSKIFTSGIDTTRTGYLPHSSLFWPHKNQTLDNYIRECDSQTRTDVEKENAHFYFSEAIISAIEYIKFSEKCQKYFDMSDEDFSKLSPFAYSTVNASSHESSAETIALAVMEAWKNRKIPTALELFWMIPQEEETLEELTASQETKVIEQSANYSTMESSQRILRRGNSTWAPPREQLIFHIHQSVSRESQLKKQNHLCAGCGRDVEKGYAHRFRYCEYTGKYFCRTCHTDKKFYLPSYIITKWEFSNKHSVSNFAFDYLNRIYPDPIFNIYDLNMKLYEKSNKLRKMNQLRWALYFLRYYIATCRFAEEKGHQQTLQSIPSYIYEHPHTYSLQDLVKTKLGELHKEFEPIVVTLREHVLGCSLCYAKGYICEICQDDRSILFPFNVQTTSICSVCQSCFHMHCHESKKYMCPKCQRTKNRSATTSTSRTKMPTNG